MHSGLVPTKNFSVISCWQASAAACIGADENVVEEKMSFVSSMRNLDFKAPLGPSPNWAVKINFRAVSL